MNQINAEIEIREEIEISQLTENKACLELSINGKLFKGLVNVLNELVDGCELLIKENRISFIIVDPAHVAMLEMNIPNKAFSVIRVFDNADYPRIGIDLDKFKDILKSVKKDDMLNMSFNADNINLSFGNVETKINYIDCSNFSEPKVPNLNLNGSFSLGVSEFHEAIRQCGIISDHLSINLDHDNILIKASNETGQETTIKHANTSIQEYARSLFPQDYLKHHYGALKAIDKKAISDIKMGVDYPMQSDTILTSDIEIMFLLAPRIENDD